MIESSFHKRTGDARASNRPLRVLELRSVWGTGGGPDKTILQGAALTDPARLAVTVCYIRDVRDPIFTIDKQAKRLNLDYVEVHERHSYDPAVWRPLVRLIRARRIDIIHAHEAKTDFLALFLARATGAVPLATVHGWSGRSRSEQIKYACDKRLLAWYPRLVAVSNEIRAELVRTGSSPERIRVVLNGIDHRVFVRKPQREAAVRQALGLAEGETLIGAVGRLETVKRFDVLLEAFARLRRPPRPRLLIIGDGPLRGPLEALASRLGLGTTCRFLGHRQDVIDLYHAMDLYVQSSDSEGTSNTILEAMALETPVVATAVGGTPELIETGVHGLLVPPGDPQALADAMEQALSDPKAAEQRRAAARARIEQQLSFAARQRTLEAIYEELLDWKISEPQP